MSDLLRLTNLGALALRANNAGIAVSANNSANVNTEGYTRQSVDFRSTPSTNFVGGVTVTGPIRADVSQLSLRERTALGESGLNGALSTAMEGLEQTFTRTGTDITAAIAEMFGAFSEVAASPTDVSLRQQVVDRAVAAADSFNTLSLGIRLDLEDSNSRIGNLASQVSTLTAEIADTNRQVAFNDDPVILDRRDLAASKLSELVGGRARVDKDGKMRYVLPGGTVLVDGNNAAELRAVVDPANDGLYRLEVVDGSLVKDVTQELDGGKLGGEIRFRDVEARTALDEIDQLAFELIANMNAVHRSNAGTDGATGRDFFVDLAGPDGAAAAMAVDPGLLADQAQLATASPGGGASDNLGALSMIDLRDQPLTGAGRSFTDQSIEVVARVGRSSANVRRQVEFDESKLEQLSVIRDSIANVSIEEELIRLSELQTASEAALKFLTTVDEMLTDLIRAV